MNREQFFIIITLCVSRKRFLVDFPGLGSNEESSGPKPAGSGPPQRTGTPYRPITDRLLDRLR